MTKTVELSTATARTVARRTAGAAVTTDAAIECSIPTLPSNRPPRRRCLPHRLRRRAAPRAKLLTNETLVEMVNCPELARASACAIAAASTKAASPPSPGATTIPVASLAATPLPPWAAASTKAASGKVTCEHGSVAQADGSAAHRDTHVPELLTAPPRPHRHRLRHHRPPPGVPTAETTHRLFWAPAPPAPPAPAVATLEMKEEV